MAKIELRLCFYKYLPKSNIVTTKCKILIIKQVYSTKFCYKTFLYICNTGKNQKNTPLGDHFILKNILV